VVGVPQHFYLIFMLIFNSIVICIAYLCLIKVEVYDKNSILKIISLLENILLLITLCHSCDMIPRRIKEFSDKIEESMLEYGYTDVNQRLILVGFTGMDLFKMNSNTILSVFALILSNSVILIQTSGLSFV